MAVNFSRRMPLICIPCRASARHRDGRRSARPTAATCTVVAHRRRRSVAGVFTRNRFCAAPVQVCQEHLAAGHASARS
jgi:glutamate N-acetyltransferase/amino-acid N-acetyltransferase